MVVGGAGSVVAAGGGGGVEELDAGACAQRYRGAAAVIATVCPVPDLFAAEFAKVFYTFFLRGQEETDPETGRKRLRTLTIGEALHATRWHFLRQHNNPLGLAYGLYSSAFYQMTQMPMGGRVL